MGERPCMATCNRHAKLSAPIIVPFGGRALAGGCGWPQRPIFILAERVGTRSGYPRVNIGFVTAMVWRSCGAAFTEKRAFELITNRRTYSTRKCTLDSALSIRVFADENSTSLSKPCPVAELSPPLLSCSRNNMLYHTDAMRFEAAPPAMKPGSRPIALAKVTETARRHIKDA